MRYLPFLLISYLVALFFEVIANTVGDGKLFQNKAWPVFFLLWYGALYSVAFFICRKRSLWWPVLLLAIFGPIVEVLVFRRLNIIVDPIIYGLMGFLPFWITKRKFPARPAAE